MRSIYWTCRKCNHIGVVYPMDHATAFAVLESIEGDHQDASEDAPCEIDLEDLAVSVSPTERHRAAEAEASAE
jgi:hypothetical protein